MQNGQINVKNTENTAAPDRTLKNELFLFIISGNYAWRFFISFSLNILKKPFLTYRVFSGGSITFSHFH